VDIVAIVASSVNYFRKMALTQFGNDLDYVKYGKNLTRDVKTRFLQLS
jgi:hypothetical protein